MKKLLALTLLLTSSAIAQQIRPDQIQPGANGTVLQTGGGKGTWSSDIGTATLLGVYKNNFQTDYGTGIVDVYGTSIEIGYGLTPSTLAYPYLVATYRNWTINNFAVSGASCQDLSTYSGFWSRTATNSSKALFATIHNDEGIFQIPPYRIDHVRGCRMAAMAWLGTPASQIYTAQNAAWTYGGSWANLPSTPMAAIGRYTTSVGATASISLYGKTFYIVTLRQTANNSTMSVSVDGTPTTDPLTNSTNYLQGIDITTPNGGTFSPYLIRVEAAVQGTHTISVNCTAVSGGYCSVLWAQGAGNLSSNTSQGPMVYDISPLRWGASQRSCTTNTSLCHNDQVTDIYYEEWLKEISVLAGDGINLQPLDVTNPAVYNPDDPTCGTQSDGIHPNACGAAKIAALVEQEINSAASPRDKTFDRTPGVTAYRGGLFAGGEPFSINGQYSTGNSGFVPWHALGSATGPLTGQLNCGLDNALCVQRLGQYEYGVGMGGPTGIQVIRFGGLTNAMPALCFLGGPNPTLTGCDGSQSAAGPYTPTMKSTWYSLQIGAGTAMTANHGNGTSLQHSDGTGTSAHPAVYDANGNLTDGPAGFTGSCASTTTLTVVNGIITGCS